MYYFVILYRHKGGEKEMNKMICIRLTKKDKDIEKKLKEVEQTESKSGWIKRAIRKEISNEEK